MKIWESIVDSTINFLKSTGVYKMFAGMPTEDIIRYLAMYVIIGVLFYLEIVKIRAPAPCIHCVRYASCKPSGCKYIPYGILR